MELLGRHVSSSPTQATLSQLYFLYLSFCLQQLQWRCSILRLMGSFCFDRIMFQQCLITSVQMLWLMGRLWIWVSGIQQVDFSLTSIIFQSMILIFFFIFIFSDVSFVIGGFFVFCLIGRLFQTVLNLGKLILVWEFDGWCQKSKDLWKVMLLSFCKEEKVVVNAIGKLKHPNFWFWILWIAW